MIYVECRYFDLNTMKLRGSLAKSFENRDAFTKWYDIAKKDIDMTINIMKYNPEEYPGRKLVNDAKLLRVSREIES